MGGSHRNPPGLPREPKAFPGGENPCEKAHGAGAQGAFGGASLRVSPLGGEASAHDGDRGEGEQDSGSDPGEDGEKLPGGLQSLRRNPLLPDALSLLLLSLESHLSLGEEARGLPRLLKAGDPRGHGGDVGAGEASADGLCRGRDADGASGEMALRFDGDPPGGMLLSSDDGALRVHRGGGEAGFFEPGEASDPKGCRGGQNLRESAELSPGDAGSHRAETHGGGCPLRLLYGAGCGLFGYQYGSHHGAPRRGAF